MIPPMHYRYRRRCLVLMLTIKHYSAATSFAFTGANSKTVCSTSPLKHTARIGSWPCDAKIPNCSLVQHRERKHPQKHFCLLMREKMRPKRLGSFPNYIANRSLVIAVNILQFPDSKISSLHLLLQGPQLKKYRLVAYLIFIRTFRKDFPFLFFYC